MKEYIIDTRYYYDIQLIIRFTINRYSAKNILQSKYAEAAAILKGVKHCSELAYSPNIEDIIIRINGNELWALKAVVDDLITDPCDDIEIDTLNKFCDYLNQFDVTL